MLFLGATLKLGVGNICKCIRLWVYISVCLNLGRMNWQWSFFTDCSPWLFCLAACIEYYWMLPSQRGIWTDERSAEVTETYLSNHWHSNCFHGRQFIFCFCPIFKAIAALFCSKLPQEVDILCLLYILATVAIATVSMAASSCFSQIFIAIAALLCSMLPQEVDIP